MRIDVVGLALRNVDVERFNRTLTALLSPLAHERCDDWRVSVESAVAELLDGDHVVFGIPLAGLPMHVHSMNVSAQPQRAIQTLFGRLPDLPSDPWLERAERERLSGNLEVWSRLRAFWRSTAGEPTAMRRSSFLGEVLTPGRIQDSENIDWSVGGGHVALCVSYSNASSSLRSRRSSPRSSASTVLNLLLPALKVGVSMRLAHERAVDMDRAFSRSGLTKREAEVVRLVARRASNREIAERLDLSPHTVRHHIESIFAKLGVHARRAIVDRLEH
jgi:DNA-binding CsgD family transcriptional regulator